MLDAASGLRCKRCQKILKTELFLNHVKTASCILKPETDWFMEVKFYFILDLETER